MTDQLSLYNGALRLCKSRQLSSLSENREPRRLLDGVWDNRNAIKYCLELGLWNFAIRSAMLEYDASIEPEFGYRRAFLKGDDWVATAALSANEYFDPPLDRYEDEVGYWFTDEDVIYVRYVSKDEDYGFDYSRWPETFVKVVEAYLASEIVWKITHSAAVKKEVDDTLENALKKARTKDVMNQPAKRTQVHGTWAASRRGRFYPRHDISGGG